MRALFDAYKGVGQVFARYWQHYGGWRALAISPYFHSSILLTVVLHPYWMTSAWWELTIRILPSLLGFSLAGYAIWLGFGDEKFRKLISQVPKDGSVSPYMVVSSAFAHFVTMQIGALMAAVVALCLQVPPSEYLPVKWSGSGSAVISLIKAGTIGGYFFGFLLFVYALLTALATALAVFRVASWYERYSNSSSVQDE